ncbi:MAG: endonuclease MutS2 [Oscillospiraceae bacterium]|jgi:DNA mismatch repair protein MutS2|nr:endonuclease MutS2 [Oscillospiraceae bacterium]MBQ1755589.1 endonuclease MutS2 [Oscillospiraceae bacterium]MBQ2144915.1 endonuclease MutS2 [Oscillospiraceae bacterium]MBQ4301947.1 endonuclease MutS2 [Oscillospiraceae bacterium]MBQ6030167.1 endonuclease MutS2 [Oscillospiraceae bacterium]
MTELYEKSLRKLELDRVLELLRDCAVSGEAKDRCMALVPNSDREDVIGLQLQTSDACHLINLRSSPAFQDVKDVRASLDRADRGGSLTPKELLAIAGVLRAARSAKDYYDGAAANTSLDWMFASLTPNRYLEERITGAILSEEEIADAASSELSDIRRHMRIQSAKIKESLQKLITSPSYAKFLRDPIITLRQDRYVVPVKAEFKNEIPGLIHDVSSTGSTFFIEPMSSVNANNALRELLLREKKEIERILAELSAEAAAHRETISQNYTMLVELDVIFARAKLSFRMNATAPEIRDDGALRLDQARHPLIDAKAVVPISVALGVDYDTLIITGPNTGGKTVTLKTVGLLTLMAECGLHIPARSGSFISTFDQVLADIGDEQSIEQSLSTFSAHMRNIVQVVNQCDERSLVLFDELGAGTDPAEGAALAIALIEHCRQQGSRVAATTHYAELKVYAMRSKGVTNAACEFDVETLKPTYKLLIGVPGKSNAFAISRRLGLPEEIIESARSTVSENDTNFEDVLDQLEQQRQQMEAAREEAERLRKETEQTKQKSDEYYAEMKKQKERAEAQARKEAQRILDEARRTANSVYEELKALRKQMKDAADAQGVNARQAELRRQLNEAEEKLAPKQDRPERPKPSREIRVGDTVELLKLGTHATVLALNKDGTYQLQAGILKVNVKPDEVYLLENEPQEVKKYIEKTRREFKNQAQSPELDLRGMDALEAGAVLTIFLDNAYMANLTQVRIIHGKGTGVLRKTVHDELKKNKHVKKYRLGVYGEGEDGVTIAELA